MIELSGDECFTTLDNDGFLLYYFTASWCKPCQEIYNDIIKLNKGIKDLNIFKIDISDDDNDEICETCMIKSVPSFLLFKDREYIDRIVGANLKGLISMLQNKIK